MAADGPEAVQDAALRDLRWYFHWEKPLPHLPSLSRRLNCSGEAFGSDYLVYCGPVVPAVILSLIRDKQGALDANVIRSTTDDLATEMRLFASLESDIQSGPATEHFFFPLEGDSLTQYVSDRELSEEWMRAASKAMEQTARVYEARGLHVHCLFPMVARGDPFYEVYLIADDHLDSVWSFRVVGTQLDTNPHWVYDQPHRNIPDLAPSNMADPTRWLSSVPGAGKGGD